MGGADVVTGGGGGIGRVIAGRLLGDGGSVVVPGRDDAALGWAAAHPAGRRVIALAGDAADEAVAARAAGLTGCAAAVRRFLAAGTGGDRQCLFSPGTAGRPGCPAVRDRQGRD